MAAPETVRENYAVTGMVCRSCEGRIAARLRTLTGVRHARADWRRSRVEIEYVPESIRPEAFREALDEMGYGLGEPGESGTPWRVTCRRIAAVLLCLLVLHAAGRRFGLLDLLNIFPEAEAGMGYGMLFMVGLLTSAHCVAMCGGINLSQTALARPGAASAVSALRPALLYGAGRTISYTLIGAAAGSLGAAVSFSGGAKGGIQIAAGVFMMLMALNILGLFPWLRYVTPRLPAFLSRRAGGGARRGPLYVGLLNGLMPCGPLQAMQLYALSAGSASEGALAMFLFAAGTLPLTTGLGAAAAFLGRRFMGRFVQAGAVLVFVMGFGMLGNGLTLSGYAGPGLTSGGEAAAAVLSGGIQTAETELSPSAYQALRVRPGVPVRWNLRAGPGTVNGCNNRLFIPEFGIEKRLEPGDNIIEFTPKTPGVYPYMCWMGMISSRIIVGDIDDTGETPEYDPSFLPYFSEEQDSDIPW